MERPRLWPTPRRALHGARPGAAREGAPAARGRVAADRSRRRVRAQAVLEQRGCAAGRL